MNSSDERMLGLLIICIFAFIMTIAILVDRENNRDFERENLKFRCIEQVEQK